MIYNQKAVVCSVGLFLDIVICNRGRFDKQRDKIIIIDNKKKYFIDIDEILKKKNKNTNANINSILTILNKFFLETKAKPRGFKVVIKNHIPQNYGLGSSASLIVGLLFGLNEFFKTNIDVDRMLKVATETESFFHTKSSGIDIKSVLFGGVLFFNQDGIIKLPKSIRRVFLIYTGKPVVSTKDVVEYVKHQNFSAKTWDDFGEITTKTTELIKQYKDFSNETRLNQELLEKIGVVAPDVKIFIKNISRYQIYGKICGAGTIGDNKNKSQENGVIGVFQQLTTKQFSFLAKECKKNSFKLNVVDVVESGLFMRYL